jgi:8-oxo-dGTP pyrophosphatase MutT (NUDIX family)
MENNWQTLTTRQVYNNAWIAVEHNEVVRPDGAEGIYGVVRFKNVAVGVLPVDDEGFTYLVGQFRYTLNRYSWEIPEGGCPAGETWLECAQRELAEETGLRAARWEQLGTAHLSNSATDELAVWFLATELTPGVAQPEGTEDLQVRRVPLAAAWRMAAAGEITDALSLLALLDYRIRTGR